MACTGGRGGTASAMLPTESRVDSFRVAMPQLGGRQRTVRVYLPKGYDAATTGYPVLYLQDAQQLFSPGPFGDWLIDETLDAMSDADPARAMIVVGVDNSEHRWDEYGPWVNPAMHAWVDSSWARESEGGEGAAYVDFLTQTLKPLIDRHYSTRPDRAHTAVGGSSMGALIALYAGLARPDVFSGVMAMSTAVWFAERGGPWLSDNQLLAYIGSRPAPAGLRIYLDVGTAERSRDTDPDVADRAGRPISYPRAYAEGTEAVAEALQHAGVPAEHLRHVVDPGGIHNESAWSKRFEGAVRWLFP
jgi:predicted alpha/beta superfamily hydrolase